MIEPKISVVIPVYRAEKYLEKCLETILAQTLDSIEIIMVDDGSPDESGKIADEYARRYPQITVIHQENAGQGPARNKGIDLARGEYIGFVDSDDWIFPEMYHKLYEAAKKHNADIAVGGLRTMVGGQVLEIQEHPLAGQTLTTKREISEVRKNFFGYAPGNRETRLFPNSACTSLYRRSVIHSHSVYFRDILSEDAIFNIDAYKNASVIAFTNGTDYCYRQENQISTTRMFVPNKRQRFAHFLKVLKEMAEKEEDEEYLFRVKRMAIDYCRAYITLVGGSELSFKEKKIEIREFVKIPEVHELWADYPVVKLPFKQSVLQFAIANGWYGLALWLDWIRHFGWRHA